MALFKLGAFAQALSGKAGNTVFADTKNGTVVRDFVVPANPRTDKQQNVRGKFRQSTTTFATLPKAKVDLWNRYASNLTVLGRGNKRRKREGIAVFNELTTRFLLASPTGTVPQDPPSTPFTGDTITITVTATPGRLSFTASAPNGTGVTTELLIQPLVNGNRKPLPELYRTAQYYKFAPGNLSREVTVPPGWYAAGYRFVRQTTGQATELQPLGVNQVSLVLEEGGSSRKKMSA